MHAHDGVMATLERRLQLLLDAERMDRVTREAERSGRSVSAVIRGAIDLAYSDAQVERQRAAARLLEATAEVDDGAEPAFDVDAYEREKGRL